MRPPPHSTPGSRKLPLKRLPVLPSAALIALAVVASWSQAAAAPPAAMPQRAPVVVQAPADAWPRHVALPGAVALVYAPQVERWAGNRIEFRAAVALRPAGAAAESFGTITVSAATRVDKVTRTVTLDGVVVGKSDFPTLPDRGAAFAASFAQQLPAAVRTVALDRLAASLAAAGAAPATVTVRNDPPRIVVSQSPAILVPIDGAPVLRPVPDGAGFQRVINTRALILKAPSEPQFFLRVYDGWLMANALDGPWTQPFIAPAGIDAVARKAAAVGAVDLLDGGRRANPKPSLAQGVPAIVTSQVPTELVVFRGPPDFAPIVGTQLQWATNTTSDVLVDAASGQYYVLLAGRWFRAPTLAGPWAFVASDALPADFARIPPASLAGAVLPAVAGTPQARAAAVANAIPQTASVPRKNGPTFAAKFDGPPQFTDIPGTALAYAVNAGVPVIRTAPGAYYAVKAGVWFAAAQPAGPWTLATSVPDAIYAIPPSSPVYFATFVRIYGATNDVVFEGYTPGYLGAYVAPGGTVVYGTGYTHAPWLGSVWHAAPATYGVAATPVWNPRVGYTYAFAMGLATPAWAPTGTQGARFHPGYWGAYPCCGSASANVYRWWARAAQAKRSGAGPSSAAAGMPAPARVAAAPVAVGAAPPPLPSAQADPYHAPPAPRGYDMAMVTTQDSPAALAGAAKGPAGPPQYISANAYYASLKANGGVSPDAVDNAAYASPDGSVYRSAASGWQRHAASGWVSTPVVPPAVDAQAQAHARASGDAAAMQAGSYGMSNATRFTGDPRDGWSARDAGDGGYSRTLGGDGGISAERYNYDQTVLNNEFDIAANGGWWSEGVYVGGVGWGGRFGD